LSAKDLLNEPELTNVAMLDQHHNSGKNLIKSHGSINGHLFTEKV
jgi:hypothetical protein